MRKLENYFDYYNLENISSGFSTRKRTLYLLLGYACDLKCSYCFHQNRGSNQIATSISPKLIDFLKIRVPKATKGKVNLQFWGGEPLLYIDYIDEIIKNLRDSRDYYNFMIVTNGTRINEDVVSFCNDNNITVGISHDGPLNFENRGFDPISERVYFINRLANFSGFSSVYTPKNSSFYEIYNYFRYKNELDERKRYTRIYPVIDVGLSDEVSKFGDNLRNASLELVTNFKTKLMNKEFMESSPEFNMLKANFSSYFAAKNNPSQYAELFNAYVPTVDISGKVYYDNGGKNLIGDIDSSLEELKSSFELIHSLHVKRWDKCLSCKVKPICNGGQLQGSESCSNFCDMYLKYLSPVVDLLEGRI